MSRAPPDGAINPTAKQRRSARPLAGRLHRRQVLSSCKGPDRPGEVGRQSERRKMGTAPPSRACSVQPGDQMRRIVLLVVLVLGMLVAPAAGTAETRAPRIGFLLMGSSQAGLTSAFDEFREGLRELGWVENENVVIDYRWAGENPDRLPELAADLVRLKVDVIIGSTPGVRAAQQATTSIPIIMCIADDAVKQGFVTNLAHPAGNITGMTLGSELAGKRLELLREATPKVSRVALLWNPRGSAPDYLKDTQTAAHSLGVTLQSVEVGTADDFQNAFAAVLKGRAQALVVGPGQFMFTHQKQVVEFATRNNLPSVYAWKGPGGCRWPVGLWRQYPTCVPSRRLLRRQDPQGRQTWRFAGRAADEVRFRHQPENCENTRHHHPRVNLVARR